MASLNFSSSCAYTHTDKPWQIRIGNIFVNAYKYKHVLPWIEVLESRSLHLQAFAVASTFECDVHESMMWLGKITEIMFTTTTSTTTTIASSLPARARSWPRLLVLLNDFLSNGGETTRRKNGWWEHTSRLLWVGHVGGIGLFYLPVRSPMCSNTFALDNSEAFSR